MEIGERFKNILAYNENMAKGMEDKLFFLNELPKNYEYTFVDFGCADGTLINYLVSIYNNYYTNTYIGYDISETMINLAKTNFNGNAANVLFTSNWEDVAKKLNETVSHKKKVLILSSVIHEVYSYAEDEDDITNFWRKVLNSNFDYICVRDMMCSKDLDRPADVYYKEKINNNFNKDRSILQNRSEFINYWGDFDNMKNIVHYLLKYRWNVNWKRELQENYFPITVENFLKEITDGNYNLTYFKRFRVPYLDECFKLNWDITLTDYTHIKAIFEIKKNASNI